MTAGSTEGPGSAPRATEVEIVIVGAGLSGIGAAARLRAAHPGKRIVVLEGRAATGGTWDLFRYPGVRSDSDMFTLGYPFAPWTGADALAGGAAILDYLRDTARATGVDRLVRLEHVVTAASWSSVEARWTVEAAVGPARTPARFRARFLYLCTGYYDYQRAHDAALPGLSRFAGRVVHPQWWPADLDPGGKRIVVVGSGATAISMVPALAARAAHVTMLQRSPSYVLSRPARDGLAARLFGVLPARAAARVVRGKNILLGAAFFAFCQRFPRTARRLLEKRVAGALPAGFPTEVHFSPRYDPWDERLCVVADDDLFAALIDGRASVVTGTIASFTPGGVELSSGESLEADVVVTATGLQLLAFGGIRLVLDGTPLDPAALTVYKGFMLSGVPNLAWSIGYTNASFTLRSDLTARAVCRLLAHMDRRGVEVAVPRSPPTGSELRPLLSLRSGYVRRAAHLMPRQADRGPWRLRQDYLVDVVARVLDRVDDGTMSFG